MTNLTYYGIKKTNFERSSVYLKMFKNSYRIQIRQIPPYKVIPLICSERTIYQPQILISRISVKTTFMKNNLKGVVQLFGCRHALQRGI